MKKAIITGITGQDGSYLAEHLLEKGYEVHGIKRRASMNNTKRIDHLFLDPHYKETNLKLHYGDVTDTINLIHLVQNIQPDEIYNLAGMSQVQISFATPEYVLDSIGLGIVRLMEAVRLVGDSSCRIYQASSSEMYGGISEDLLDERSRFEPRSPYANSKLYAYWAAKNYRESYGIFVSNGILFNHESPRRGENFVTRKITIGTARFLKNNQHPIYLGNLDAFRDWGHAKDFVKAMHMMLLHNTPDDFVVATGHATSVRQFCSKVFSSVGIEIEFIGSGISELGIVSSVDLAKFQNKIQSNPPKSGTVAIRISEDYLRPSDIDYLVGDASKISKTLGWQKETTLDQMIEEMLVHDLNEQN